MTLSEERAALVREMAKTYPAADPDGDQNAYIDSLEERVERQGDWINRMYDLLNRYDAALKTATERET